MSTQNPTLPAELWHLIMGFSAADISSLTTLSQLSWAFHATSRPFLFHSITINGKLKKRAEDLILLLHENPEVAGYVRSLKFSLSPNELEFEPSILEGLASAFQTITRLEDLEISCPQELADLSLAPWPLLESTFAHLLQLSTLQTLSLLRFRYIPASVIRNLKNIRSLRMVGSTIDDNDRISHPSGLDVLTGCDDGNRKPIPLDNLDLHIACEITNHLLFFKSFDHKPPPQTVGAANFRSRQ
ncbi:hypothetical protein CPB83DRAFT_853706 [Crepidotus variabilis]|uniref:F-box domain-containing protein n=1 Tax=Crepidotus variabilis TaxID=179855 RepID=A0A9P6EGN3_9AGAR|nr:hypothetical protein CPB83DRAFT_853706 [Crepidotus variabilis]